MVADVLQGVAGHLDARQLKELASALEQAGEMGLATIASQLMDTDQRVVATPLVDNAAPDSVEAAYLKLHLISHRLVTPHETDLTGLFGLLPNVAWTDQGPIDLNELPQRQLDARLRGTVLEVSSVDKFPKMTNYVVPAAYALLTQPGCDWALTSVRARRSCMKALSISTQEPKAPA